MAAMVADEIPFEAEPLAVEQDTNARLVEQGIVYAATADEAVQDAAVITGTLPTLFLLLFYLTLVVPIRS